MGRRRGDPVTAPRHLPGCPAQPGREWAGGRCICQTPEQPPAPPDPAAALSLEIHDARPSAPNAVRDGGL
jgi:hypothetical protein